MSTKLCYIIYRMGRISMQKISQEKKLILMARVNPTKKLNTTRWNEKEFNPGAIKSKPLGRYSVARLLYINRVKILNCSLKTFSQLCTEDYRRELYINGANITEINEIQDISSATVMRIEEIAGSEGVKAYTLRIISYRLVNPNTKKFFTPLELQALNQGEDEIDLEYIETQEYIKLGVELNQRRNQELYYP